jgi:hypothetical protein
MARRRVYPSDAGLLLHTQQFALVGMALAALIVLTVEVREYMDWGPIIAAAITGILSSSVLAALIAYFANRGKSRADAAATNVETAIPSA